MDFEPLVRWTALVERLYWDRGVAGQVYDRIIDSYSQYFRVYHNMDHLAECFRHFDRVRPHLARPDLVEYALWLHDLVCVPGSRSNEELSAMAAEQWAYQLGAPAGFGQAVRHFILLTRHDLADNENERVPPDAAYLLDIDLAVLAREGPGYDTYETAIRREYAYLDTAVYRKGRCQVLEHFLTRPQIYRTEEFSGPCEQRARENIRQAIHRLNYAEGF